MNAEAIVIIGAGPSSLIAAYFLASKGHLVHIYEQKKAPARKFLVAGHGGFNLTHSEDIEEFILHYNREELHQIIRDFDNTQTIKWLENIGIKTYKGSSGKIFPIKNTKPIEVLNAILSKLKSLNVQFFYEHQLIDFSNSELQVLHKENLKKIKFKKLILGLGGGSWSKTGSDAKWVKLFQDKNIKVETLEASNSGYNTKENFQDLDGKILKNVAVKFKDIYKKGEILFTNYGIEGSPMYYLNRYTRNSTFPTTIYIDFKPSLGVNEIFQSLSKSVNITKTLKEKLKLSQSAIALLKRLPKEEYIDTNRLSKKIKDFPIEVTGLRPIEEVISTAGGVSFSELHHSLNLIKYPNVYCIGEMVDWDAPTGGYLLQACFSMGAFVAKQIDIKIEK